VITGLTNAADGSRAACRFTRDRRYVTVLTVCPAALTDPE